jgi:hypothetical protein
MPKLAVNAFMGAKGKSHSNGMPIERASEKSLKVFWGAVAGGPAALLTARSTAYLSGSTWTWTLRRELVQALRRDSRISIIPSEH